MKKGKHKQFCIHGHDTFIVGRYDGQCKICKNEQSVARRKEKDPLSIQINGTMTREQRKPKRICKNGHDTFECGRTKDGHCFKCRSIERIKHKNQIRKQKIKYRKENKEKLTTYVRNKRRTNIQYRLASRLRSRLSFAIKNNQKVGSAVMDLGCTIEFLKAYLESMFYAKMAWNNYGIYWEIDHIIPFVEFDLTNRKQFLKAVHYTNLQPLTKADHQKKTAKEKRSRSKINKNIKEK